MYKLDISLFLWSYMIIKQVTAGLTNAFNGNSCIKHQLGLTGLNNDGRTCGTKSTIWEDS